MSARRVVAVITVECDDLGDYYAHAACSGHPAPIAIGPTHTIGVCLEKVWRALLDVYAFPRVRHFNPKVDPTP